ncbi:copia protein [Trichonephila clavipes]|nr:copia protein [Trichonephila clavipes]
MDNFLTELGIKHEVTNSYTPEMNGVAERFNLTALDGIKTLLKSSEVPHKFWGEALLCFTYAWNRICPKDSNKTPFEKYSGRKPLVLHLIPFGCLAYAGVLKQFRKKFALRTKMGIMMGYAQRTKGYRIWLIDENKLVETINVRYIFDENKRGINFRQKVNSNLGYNLNLPDYYDDEDDFDRVKDSLTSRLVSKTSTETPSTSEKPDVSSDHHSLMPCIEVKWIRNIGRKVTGSNVYYSIEGKATRLKYFNEIERYCKRHNIEYDPSLFNFRKDNTESQGFSDLSEQQESLMVEVTIPNCYKQAIRSRDASKWHDAMDKEINVMKERKVWDLVDHPDNIKILENRWVYTIKYDENDKIVRYKARLVARDTVIYIMQPTGYEIDNNKVCKLRKAIYGLHQSGCQWFLELENKLIKLKFKNLELFFMNSVASTLNRVKDMEFNNQISVLTQNNWNTWKHDMQVLLMHYGCWQFIIQTKPEQPDEEATYKEKLDLQLREDVGIFISRVKTAATRLQEAGHKLDDLYIGFQLIRWLPQEFQSTVQQIYRWKEEDFRVVKIEAELILEANRLQLMKQDLEKAENAYLSSFTSKKSKTFPGATAAAHGDPNGKNDYQKKGDLKPITNMKMSLATEDKSCPVEGIGTLRFRPDHYIIPKSKEINFFSDVTAKTKNGSIEIWHQRFCHVNNDYLVKSSKNDSVKGLPRLTDNVSKTSTETPSTSEKPDVSSDHHSLMPCIEVKWIRNIGRKVTGSNVYYSIEGKATRLKYFNEIERYCKRHNIEYDPSLFNFRKDNTESQGFSDLSEQQEALMVEVTIPNCYKQAIRSRDASKWHDAMDKEINVMKERKVWDLVDHPDNIKILENRWVYTIKYDENDKIVRYKARLVARGNTQLRGESFDEVFSPVINFTIVRLFFTICVCLWKWTHIQV